MKGGVRVALRPDVGLLVGRVAVVVGAGLGRDDQAACRRAGQ